jgi:putative hydrolase of the HAD superfamily
MTLWDFEKAMRHSLYHALAEVQKHLPEHACADLTIERMIEIRNTVAGELNGKRLTLEQIRFEAFRGTLSSMRSNNDELAAYLNEVCLKHRFEDIELYPDILPTLDLLGSRYALGLISNGNSYPERCGLRERFTFVVLSQDLGVEKPDPAIFRAACRKVGYSPRQLLHVGDSLETDAAGAFRAGALSFWLNRTLKPNRTDIRPHCEIHALTDLEDFLDPNPHRTSRNVLDHMSA